MRRGALLLALSGLALIASGCRPRVGWTISFDPSSLADRAEVVHAEIRAGGCTGAPSYVTEVRRGTSVGPVPPVIGSGRWGFAADARDTSCGVFASACQEVDLPGPSQVTLVLHEITPFAACDVASCSSGICSRGDASVSRDAATSSDAGHDAGARDANWQDTGPPNVGAAELPYLACGSTLEDAIDPFIRVVTGSVAHVPIMHRDGICSTTCTEEVLRLADGTTIEGHFAQSSTFELLAAREPGGGTATIEVCGAAFGSVSMAGSGTPGFESIPYTSITVSSTADCTWRLSASGGSVAIRRFDHGCVTPSGMPTVDVKIDGMDGIHSATAPASAMLTWSTTEASSCVGSGTWSGPRPPSGSVPLLHLVPGDYTFALDCANSAGTGTDSATLQVTP